MRLGLFSFCGFWGFSTLLALDVVTLKNGQKLEGLIEESQETPTTLVLNKSTLVGISDWVTLSKSEIETVVKGDGSDDPAFQLQLPKDSVEPLWYDLQVRRILDRWLSYHAQSPKAPEILRKKAAFLEEVQKVRQGLRRLGPRWLTADEYKEVQNDERAAELSASLSRFAANTQPLDVLEVLARIPTIASSALYPDVVEAALKAIALVGESLTPTSMVAGIDKRQARLRTAIAVEADYIRQTVNTPPISGALLQFADSVRFAGDGRYYLPEEIVDPGYSEFSAYYEPNGHAKIRLSEETLFLLRNKLAKITEYRAQLSPLAEEKENVAGLYQEVLRKLKAEGDRLQKIDTTALRRVPKIWDDADAAALGGDFSKAFQLALQAHTLWPQFNAGPFHLNEQARHQLKDVRVQLAAARLPEAQNRLASAQKLAALIPSSQPRRIALDKVIEEVGALLQAERLRGSDALLAQIPGALFHLDIQRANALFDEATELAPDNPGLSSAKQKIHLFYGLAGGGGLMGAWILWSLLRNGIPMLIDKFTKKAQPRRRSSLNRKK